MAISHNSSSKATSYAMAQSDTHKVQFQLSVMIFLIISALQADKDNINTCPQCINKELLTHSLSGISRYINFDLISLYSVIHV